MLNESRCLPHLHVPHDVTCFPEPAAKLTLKQEVLGKTNRLLSRDKSRTQQKTMPKKLFSAAGTSLPSCYLAMIEGYSLPNPCQATIGGIHVQTHRLMGEIYEVRRWDGLRCNDTHTKFRKDDPGSQKLMEGYTHRHTQEEDRISLLLFFYQNKKKYAENNLN
jgi:hypothetical protein